MVSGKNEYHVLYIITKLELGGAQKVCLSLLKGLNQNRGSATLISGMNGVLTGEAKKCGPTILMPELVRELGVKGLFSEIKALFALVKQIKEIKKEHPKLIIHTHSSKAGILGRWAAWLAGCKNIVHTIHGHSFNDYQLWPVRLIARFLEFITSFITTKFVVVSKKDAIVGAKLIPSFKEKSTLIRAAVSDQSFNNNYRKYGKEIVIGSIGCFKPQKNLTDLISSFARAKRLFEKTNNGRMRLEIVGDGAMRPILEKLICDLSINSSVTLLGWQENVSLLFSRWDIFAMSSLWEGLPCAVVEARLSGLPVVAYNVGGISEIIFEGKNGYLVEPGNRDKLSECLFKLAESEKLRTDFSEYKDDLNDFFNENMIGHHKKLYRSIFN
jgi:glycosyltransferase involved in cell wall biosynthesis